MLSGFHELFPDGKRAFAFVLFTDAQALTTNTKLKENRLDRFNTERIHLQRYRQGQRQ